MSEAKKYLYEHPDVYISHDMGDGTRKAVSFQSLEKYRKQYPNMRPVMIDPGAEAAQDKPENRTTAPASKSWTAEKAALAKQNADLITGLSDRINARMAETARLQAEESRKRQEAHEGRSFLGRILTGPAYMAQSESGIQENRTDGLTSMLESAKRLSEDSQKIINEARNKGETTFAEGALRGLRDTVFDEDTWLAGISDLVSAAQINGIVKKAEEGGRLTEEEEMLLESVAVNAAVNAMMSGDLGRGYKAGTSVGESIPFMWEFLANPASGLGKTIAGRAAKAALRKGAKTALAKAASIAARGAGDVAGATAMALTTGAARTAADMTERNTGQAQFTIDDSGNAHFAGTENAVPWGKAARQAVAAGAIENYSEMLGSYFGPVLKSAGRFARRGFDEIPGLRQVASAISKTKSSDWAKSVGDFLSRTGWNGTTGEFAEEIAGGVLNSMLVGDQTPDTAEGTGVFNPDNMIDTYLGVALFGGFTSAVQTLGYRSAAKRARTNAMNADYAGMAAFGEQWDGLKVELDAAARRGEEGLADMAGKKWRMFESENATPEQKRAYMQYARSIAELQGVAKARAKRERENPIATAAEDSWNAGAEMPLEELQEAYRAMTDAGSRLSDHEKMLTSSTVDSYARKNAGRKDDLAAYFSNLSAIESAKKRYVEEKKAEYDTMAGFAEQYRNQDGGSLQLVSLKNGEKAYVRRGSLAFNQDGTLDVPASEKLVTYVLSDEAGNPTEERRQGGAAEIESLIQEQTVEQFLSPALAALDNAESDFMGQVSSPSEKQIMESIASMPIEIGDELFLRNADGTISKARINGKSPDSSVGFMVETGGEVAAIPEDELRAMIVPAYTEEGGKPQENAASAATSEAQAAPPRPDTEARQEEIPRDKDGNIMYDRLLLADPQAYMREYAAEFGEEAAMEDMAAQIGSISDEIRKKQDELKSASSTDKKAKARREIAALSQRKAALETIAPPVEEVQVPAEQKNVIEEETEIPKEQKKLTDRQGNPVDENGSLLIENVQSIDEITDEDFDNPYRNIGLPAIPENIDMAIGANGKPVIIKKNIFKKNDRAHNFTPRANRQILQSALYNPDLVGQSQPMSHKTRFLAIKIDEKSPITVLEASERKENVEVISWYTLDNRNLERLQRQAEREGGEFLILTPKGAAASLSALPSGQSSNSEGSANPEKKQEDGSPDFTGMPADEAARMIADKMGDGAASYVEDNIEKAKKNVEGKKKRKAKSTDFNKRIAELDSIRKEVEKAKAKLASWESISKSLAALETVYPNAHETPVKTEQSQEARLSEELDENGYRFVVSSNGTTTFGEIREDSGLAPAPIKLSEGFQDKDGKGYGLAHIEANHGNQIRNAGFASVEDFVSYVATNYDEDNIRVGKRRYNGSTTYLIQIIDTHDNTLFIEMSKDGTYWNVNSAGIFRKGYSNKNETVVKTEPQQPNNAVSTGSSLSENEEGGITSSEPNGEPTVSENKYTENSSQNQEEETGDMPEEIFSLPEDIARTEKENPIAEGESLMDYARRKAEAYEKSKEKKEAALASRIEVLDDDWEEGNGEFPTYKRSIIIDGKHAITQVDEPNEKGEYTGSYFEYDGKRFAGIPEVASYIDSSPTLGEKVAEAEKQVDTNPTEPQKEAGNYRKGHVQVGHFDVTIENPKGSVRSGVDADGNQWSVTMNNSYGYIRGTEGVDGDHIDVFLSDDIDGWNGSRAFVIDQYNEDGSFDEHKVMLGFNEADEAQSAFTSNYGKEWAEKRKLVCTPVAIDEFEKWINSSHRKTKPFAEYKTVNKDTEIPGIFTDAYNSTYTALTDTLKGNIPNVKAIQAKIRDYKKRIKTLQDGAATGVSSNEQLRKTENAIEKLRGEQKAYEDILQAINDRMAATEAEQIAGYSIESAQYTTKRGKVLDMRLVKFSQPLTKEQQEAARELAKAEKGWYDRERDGYMMRSEESAQKLADTIINNEEAVEDAQPISLDDARRITDPQPRKVDVIGLMEELKEKGETKLSDHVIKEKPQDSQPASSDQGRQDLTTGSTVDSDAVQSAKITINKLSAKHELNNIVHKYVGKRTTRGFIKDLAVAMGDHSSKPKQSYYFGFKDNSGIEYTLRLSNHNVNGENAGENEKEISIVIKSRRQPNRFVAGNAEVTEYVYFKEAIAQGDGQTLAWIAQDLADMLDTGIYADRSGIAIVNTNPTLNDANRTETKPSNKQTPSGNKLVTDERYEELKRRMKAKLGQLNVGIDPEILAIGTEMAVYHIEKGARRFADYARAMIADLGDVVRPYLKAFYNGARDLPEVEDSGLSAGMTSYDKVRTFDVANFDKESTDPFAAAETMAAEHAMQVQADRARQEIMNRRDDGTTKERNKAGYAEKAKENVLSSQLKGTLFADGFDLRETPGKRNEQAGESPKFSKGEKVLYKGRPATVFDIEEDGRPVLDTGLAPVMYEVAELSEVKRLNDNENGTGKQDTRSNHSGTQSRSEELPASQQMGAGTPAQDTARDSQGKRVRPRNGGGEPGTRPRNDVGRNYSNDEIEEIVSSVTGIVDGKVVLTGEVTDGIKDACRQYESGGISKKGRGVLDEYYTDGKIVDAVNLIVSPYFKDGKAVRVLEPSVGIGNFIEALRGIPVSEITAFEINETAARITKALYPQADVNLRSFETEFIDEEGNKKPLPRKYGLVIGNPPYGSHRGLYKGLGEESKIARYEDYFVKRSLDVLEDGGVLAMVLPSSWMDRHAGYGGYAIEAAYRLPSGAFEATKVGTDIVVLRKDSSVPYEERQPYFDGHPERILGETKQRKGRFGKTENYVEGDIDSAIAAIERDQAARLASRLGIEETSDNLDSIQSAIEETGNADKAAVVVECERAAARTEKAAKPESSRKAGNGKYKVELNRGAEAVPASLQFPNGFSKEEAEAFADTGYDGTLRSPEKHGRYANYIDGKTVHDFYYAEGDIYGKLTQLERDKAYIIETFGPEQYEKQKRLLENVLPKRKGLDEISISPNTAFVKNLKISAGENAKSLKDMFVDFCRKLPYQAFGDSSGWEVVGYVNNEQVYGQDKRRNQLVRERRKRAANDLFTKFLHEELSEEDKQKVVFAFNREYNSTYRPDYSKVPIFSSINKDFKGKDLKLTSVQLAGIGRMTVKGVGVLAHEVGFGKTLSGVLSMHEAMTRGFAKRPLIVVPNDNILQQWVETIYEALPSATVNELGNLGASYDLTGFNINDGEFTIITYEGLKAMTFSDETYDSLADRFSYITEDLKAHKSERDKQKNIEKRNELKGKMKRGAKKSYNFEDFGFDWLTFDEVHNANHIVSKVRLDKSVASDFRSQSQRTSDLGMKTWIAAQYIQEHNNGRNVLLLSATPFTNKPLEYYSILSLVGNDMLRRKGFFNIDQFFSTFMEADNELEIGANGRPVQKTNVRRFRNNGMFQQLLSEFIDIKGEEDNPDLVRPERRNKEYKIAQNELTAEAMEAAQELLSDNDTVLQGIGHARAAAFSPYATPLLGLKPKDHREFVRNSPKIDAAVKMIEQNKKDRPDAGQIMYSEVGVEFFPMIRDYLVKESGFKPEEVRIITGSTTNDERVNIQAAFNKGDVKVVIGSPAIKEGLNLQENTTDMYILSLPWNFTQLRQIEGRGWRQGNKWENIRINYLLTNDSIDVFMLQRLQLKQGLYNEAMKSGAESLDVSDIDTSELKTALITDPEVRAEIVALQEREKLQQERTRIEADMSFMTRKYEAYNKLVEELGRQKDVVELYQGYSKGGKDSYWVERAKHAEYGLRGIQEKIGLEKQNLLNKGVDVDDIERKTEQSQKSIEEIQRKIDDLENYRQELAEKYRREAESKAKEQEGTLSAYLEERKEENKSGFYKIRPQEENERSKESGTEGVLFRAGNNIDEVNARFNEQLQRQIDGTLPKGHVYQLGLPGEILRSTGIPALPIELSSTRLAEKARQRNHEFAIADVKGLPEAMQNPIAVFSYGNKDKAQNIIVEIERDGKNFVVGLHLNQNRRGLDINDIRGIFPKDNAEWLNWITQGKLLHADKAKIQTLIDKQRTNLAEVEYLDLDSITNIVKNFENPKPEESLYRDEPSPRASHATADEIKEGERQAVDMAKKLNIGNRVKFVNSNDVPEERLGAKGWYDISENSITIVTDNHESADDMVATLLHEGVGHYGLRNLAGKENFESFIWNVYENLGIKERGEIMERARRAGLAESGSIITATEEYLSELAETAGAGNNESLWDKARRAFSRLLRKLGINARISDAELRYILRMSGKALQEGTAYREARKFALETELGLNTVPVPEGIDTNDRAARYRLSKASEKKKVSEALDVAAEQSRYNMELEDTKTRIMESYVDGMKSVRILQDEISKASGKPLREFEDVWTAENHRSSKNRAEMEFYKANYYDPMAKAIRNFMDAASATFEDVSKYVVAKHGLERNEAFAKRDSEETGKPFEEMRKRDYSGLTSLFPNAGGNVAVSEKEASEFVEEMEGKAGAAASALWDSINAATKKSLLKEYESGLISRQLYERIRDMFQYYVPLRGFEEETAEDVYDYVRSGDFRGKGLSVKRAKGRTSLAFNPFAYIVYNADMSIVAGNKNLMKQRLYNLAANHKSPLLSVSNVWVENRGTEQFPEWERTFPDLDGTETQQEAAEKIARFEERMQSLAEEGRAMKMKGSLMIPYRIGKRNERQHAVFMKIAGQEYAVYVNGNPKAAQAINGMRNEGLSLFRRVRAFSRWMAANFTTRSPKFIIRNMTRDSLYAMTAVYIKEDSGYFKKFRKNLGANYRRMWQLIRKYQDGNLDMGNEIERYMKEFIENGGETGYTALLRVEQYSALIKKMTKDADRRKISRIKSAGTAFLDVIDYLNRCAEDMGRFACYVTSRQSGRSIERSVSDAKNVTVNFNTKGSGSGFGAAWFTTSYLFFNAGIQGLSNFVKLAKANPKKFAKAMSLTFAAGIAVPVLNSILSAVLGGDDDDYLDLPDWIRRNNIVLGANGYYITVPLGIEQRAIYGMGDIVYSWMSGKMKHKNVALEILGQASSMMPIDMSGGEGLAALVPDMFSPIMQAWINKDFTGRPIYKDYDWMKHYPGYEKAYAGTNRILVKSAELLNSITGGDVAVKGGVNVNPAIIEHLAQGYFGGTLSFWNEVYKTASMAWDDDARQVRNVPLLNVFLTRNDERTMSSYDNELYYHYRDEKVETETQIREYKRNPAVYGGKLRDLYSSEKYIRYEIFKSYDKRIRKLRESLKNADSREKERQIDEQISSLKLKAIEQISKYDD